MKRNPTRQWEVIDDGISRRIRNGGPFKSIGEAWKVRREFLKTHKDTPPCNIFIYRSEKIDGQWVGEAVN